MNYRIITSNKTFGVDYTDKHTHTHDNNDTNYIRTLDIMIIIHIGNVYV